MDKLLEVLKKKVKHLKKKKITKMLVNGENLGQTLEESNMSLSESHGKSYSYILNAYVINTYISIILKVVLKLLFFSITMYILWITICIFRDSIDFVSEIIKEEELENLSLEGILGIVTVVAPTISSLIVAFIKLPEIIARYLFNEKEDDSMNNVIKNIQDHDRDIMELNQKYHNIVDGLLDIPDETTSALSNENMNERNNTSTDNYFSPDEGRG